MERHEREALDRWLTNPWEVEAPDPEQDEPDEPELVEPGGIFSASWADGWEPYDDRPELVEARLNAALGGTTAVYPGAPTRVQHWYDLDAATAAALMVLGALAAPVLALVVFVARRFRVVRR